jgi:hypothetical protein
VTWRCVGRQAAPLRQCSLSARRCERMANAPFRAVFLDECAARDGAHDFGVKVQPASRGALDEPMLSSAGQNPSMSARKRFSAPSAGSVAATSNPLARK